MTLLVKRAAAAKLVAVLGATIGFGFAAARDRRRHLPAAIAGGPGSVGWIGPVMTLGDRPERRGHLGNIAFVVLVVRADRLVQLRGWRRFALMVPTVYLAACCWEARLVAEPAITGRSCSARSSW